MHFRWFSCVLIVGVLTACSSPDSRPACAMDDAQRTLSQLLWQDIEQQLTRQVGAANVKEPLEISRLNLSIQISGITTTETSKEVRQVSCRASVAATVPDTLAYDLARLTTLVAKEGGNLRMDGRTLSDQVEYRVSQSDDLKTIRVEARGISRFTGYVTALGLAFYGQSLRVDAPSPATALQSPVQPGPPTAEATSSPQEAAVALFQAADTRLNSAYQAVRARLDEAQRMALRDEQRAWIKRRDETCSEARIEAESKGDIAGGSAMEMAVMACKTKMTDERLHQISGKG